MSEHLEGRVVTTKRISISIVFAVAVATGVGQAGPANEERPCVIVVVGAPGAAEYGEEFARQAETWEELAKAGEATLVRLGPRQAAAAADEKPDREQLGEAIARESGASGEPLWLVLIGHGTYDGKLAKFNLRGPDVAAGELAVWLARCERPVAIVNCASSSGPFINRLSAPDRVVVTATKSGSEHNYARFGRYLAKAMASVETDIDKDEQVSLLEAFLAAAAATEDFYAEEARLATEHALIDDNGDGRGTPAAWFRGVHPVRRAKDGATPDGRRATRFVLVRGPGDRDLPAEVRRRRDELEMAILTLRDQQASLGTEAYYAKLEPVVLELARLYEQVEPDPESAKPDPESAKSDPESAKSDPESAKPDPESAKSDPGE